MLRKVKITRKVMVADRLMPNESDWSFYSEAPDADYAMNQAREASHSFRYVCIQINTIYEGDAK